VLKIGYLGIRGSNSYAAAKQYFFETGKLIGVSHFLELFQALKTGVVNRIIIPVENSLAGSVVENYDLIRKYHFQVVGEYYLQFENHLLGVPECGLNKVNNLKKIKQVFSHPQALAQCSQFFKKHHWVEQLGFTDTAAAARFVAKKGDMGLAAIGNREAALIYNLEIVKKNIADDNQRNYTRFFILSKPMAVPKNANRCSLFFTLKHRPGSLCEVLTIFAKYQLNLLKIESRPIHGRPFKYFFFTDFEWGKQPLNKIKSIIQLCQKKTLILKILGFYQGGRL